MRMRFGQPILDRLEERLVMATIPTMLDVSAVMGTYGGTADVSATLTSGGVKVPNESVDLRLGVVDLGAVVTDANGIAAIKGAALGFKDVGNYIGFVTASFAGDTTYSPSTGSADLTVTPAPLTVVVDDQTKVFGQANPMLTGTVTGVLNMDNVSAVFATTATDSSGVVAGGYPITVSGLSGPMAGNYAVSTSTPGMLTVTPAPLTITANKQSKVYGQANPAFTAAYQGFVLGQDATALSGTLGFTTTATANSHVGTLAVTPNGLSSANYAITFAPGSLAITPAPLSIAAVNVLKTYGLAVPALTATYSGFVNGDTPASLTTPVSLASPVTSASHYGVYPITASGAASADYTISFTNGAIAVTPAPLTVTPVNVIDSFGIAVPPLTATYSGFVNGDTPASLTSPVRLSTAAVAGSPPGVYPITVSGGASADYTIVSGPGAVAIVADAGRVAFVSSLYRSILGRSPGTYGLVSWLTALADGKSESEVAGMIYNSIEGHTARAKGTVPFVTERDAYHKALLAQARAQLA